MAQTRKVANEKIKKEWIEKITAFLKDCGEDVLRVKSGEIAFPVVGEIGNEEFLKITFSIPTGSRDGEPYDGYGEAESYTLKLKQDEEKAKERAAAKAKKIAKDEKYRAKKEAEKEERGE